MNPYIGHDSQVYGIEEHRLVGGKGDGMASLYGPGFLGRLVSLYLYQSEYIR